ncbi:hypothetical protein [Dyadobacter sp. CY312]|uniref:hypothetical protein n=1 Tax=Dyadobacter sp. CY312 TaxID=2907303 RepID=UPI001F45BB8A|nr:hypothetical protein [Dyadobacter sp. CY312]MCE7038975.1 hypothetical protein [Dyadobacter sp. CY312]
MNTELPSYELSLVSSINGYSTDPLDAYILFREHWELIDLVFQIETPKVATKEDIVTLQQVLFAENKRKENEVIIQMIALVDDLYLDTLTSKELEAENEIRELCCKGLLAHLPATYEEKVQLCSDIREEYNSR